MRPAPAKPRAPHRASFLFISRRSNKTKRRPRESTQRLVRVQTPSPVPMWPKTSFTRARRLPEHRHPRGVSTLIAWALAQSAVRRKRRELEEEQKRRPSGDFFDGSLPQALFRLSTFLVRADTDEISLDASCCSLFGLGVDHASINGACSWRCLLKTRTKGKDEASSPTEEIPLATNSPKTA